ncbi:MAG: hypothetical protein AAF696_12250, partial [Bacteroidota bacterium]
MIWKLTFLCLFIGFMAYPASLRGQAPEIKLLLQAPVLAELNPTDIWNVDILNSTQRDIGVVLVAAVEGETGILYQAQSPLIKLRPGLNRLSQMLPPSLIQVQFNKLGKSEEQESLRLCIDVLSSSKTQLAHECQDHIPLPTAPPRLVYHF